MATKSTTSTKTDISELEDIQTTVVSVAELETALAAGKKNIFLKSGPTYNLTQSIVPYNGLTLRGEQLPSDANNEDEDGVRIFHTSVEPILYNTTSAGLTAISGLTITDGTIEDNWIVVTAGLTHTIKAGTVITFDDYSYIIGRDLIPAAGGGTIRLNSHIVRDFTGLTSFDLYETPLVDFTIDTITIDDDDGQYSKIYGGKNIKYINCFNANTDWMMTLVYNSVGVEVKDSGFLKFGLYNSSEIAVHNCNGDEIPDGILIINDCSYFEVRNCRGFYPSILRCRYFEFRNSHSELLHYYKDSHYFTVDSCTTRSNAVGFDLTDSTNFTLTNCAADTATTAALLTGTSNYQIYGDRWQGDVVNIDDNGSLPTPSLVGVPTTPIAGQVYWDTSVKMLYCYTNATSGWMPLL